MKTDILFKDQSYQIMGACFEVYTGMGNGFLESVYQECLAIEFSGKKISHIEHPILKLKYKNHILKQSYVPDFLCYDQIIVEIKAVKKLIDEHRAQVINYLKATNLQLGILINFGHYPLIESERFVNTNSQLK